MPPITIMVASKGPMRRARPAAAARGRSGRGRPCERAMLVDARLIRGAKRMQRRRFRPQRLFAGARAPERVDMLRRGPRPERRTGRRGIVAVSWRWCWRPLERASLARETETDLLAADLARWSGFWHATPPPTRSGSRSRRAARAALDRVRAGPARRAAPARPAAARERPREPVRRAATWPTRTAEQRRDQRRLRGGVAAHGRRPAATTSTAARPPASTAVRPVALRAMAEAAQAKLPVYYDASLEYGRSTTPDSGLFYLGRGAGAARLRGPGPARSRALGPRTAAPCAASRAEPRRARGRRAGRLPAAGLDREASASSSPRAPLLKEARELRRRRALRYGALLQVPAGRHALRARCARWPPRTRPPRSARARRRFEARLAERGVDHSIGRLFLENAQADLAEHATDGAAVDRGRDRRRRAAALLRRARAAAGPAAAGPRPQVTVTLVRWPYT